MAAEPAEEISMAADDEILNLPRVQQRDELSQILLQLHRMTGKPLTTRRAQTLTAPPGKQMTLGVLR